MVLSIGLRASVLLAFLLPFFALAAGADGAASVTLRWDRNDEPDIAGYRLYYGTTSHSYDDDVESSTTTATISNLIVGKTYFFAVTAYDTTGLESDFSDEVSYTVAPTPTPSPSPTPSPTPTPSPSPTPSPTSTPSPSPTPSPPPTPKPSPTPSPTPTPKPSPSPSPTPSPSPGEVVSALANVSSRAFVQTGDFVLIGGFILTTDFPKTVAVRAIGPSLSSAGVSQVLADPTLELLDSSGSVIASNDDWRSGGVDLAALGLAPTDDRESTLVATLPAGAYSAIVRGKGNTVGVGLVELYNLGLDGGGFANISTRARVETGEDVLIGGFILAGPNPSRVIVRAIGPSLSAAGVPDPLLDPVLELHDFNGSLIFTNDNWRSDQESQIIDSALPPSDDREAAIVATLPPGAYSAIVRGANSSSGVALFEVYALNQ
jgi:biotin carboxyl carrier protein